MAIDRTQEYTFVSRKFPRSSIGEGRQNDIKKWVAEGMLPGELLHDIRWSKETKEFYSGICSIDRANFVYHNRSERPELYLWLLTHAHQTCGLPWDWSERFAFDRDWPRAYTVAYEQCAGSYVFTRYLDGRYDTYHHN